MIAIQTNNIDDMLKNFRSAVLTKSESSRLNYVKAINCLETFLGTYTYSQEFPSEQTLADWFLNMRLRGISEKTTLHYIDIVSALYKETASDCDLDKTKIIGQFKLRVKQITEKSNKWGLEAKAFNKLLSIIKSTARTAPQQLASDILLLSLLKGATALSEIAKIKTSEVEDTDDSISVIVKRNSAPNRKYLFPLNQSNLTCKQLERFVESLVQNLLIENHIPVVHKVDNTIKLIWALAALRCGIPGTEIVAILGSAVNGLPELSLCAKADISDEYRKSLMNTVNTMLSNNPLRWYAMKLRSRVGFEDIEERVKNLDENLFRPEFFYPYDEICKRVGKKIVKDKQPVIRDIVFFKLRVTDIFPLFCKIGDLAWCYTTTGKPGGDYAPIPKKSFERFQDTIGHFTPEYEVAPIGGFEPKEGESVVIINGPLANYEFEVDRAKDTDNVIFQLNMIGDNGFQWRTSAKKRQLEPVSTK